MDVLGTPAGQIVMRDSNIGMVSLQPGGVGRNIAAQIAKAGAECMLFTAFGSDLMADMLLDDCIRKGIDVRYALRVPGNTCIYLCVHDETGDMLVGINDMALTEALTSAYVHSYTDVVNTADLCVIEANLPEQTLRYIAEHVQVPLLLDPVSCAKAERVRGILPYLTAIKPNIYEARLLTGHTKPQDCARALIQLGVKKAFVSLGEEGICWADAEQCAVLPVPRKSNAPKTGAGDALCTGLALALAEGEDTLACAKAGMERAEAFLQNRT